MPRIVPPAVSRRHLLIASVLPLGVVGLGSLTSCSDQETGPEAIEIQPTKPEQPDENLLDEFALIGAYLGAIAAFPELRGTLTALADQHRAHAQTLGATVAEIEAIAPIAPAAVRIKPVLGELIARERAGAALRAETAVRSEAPDQIRALTFIAASESSHVPELRDVRANA